MRGEIRRQENIREEKSRAEQSREEKGRDKTIRKLKRKYDGDQKNRYEKIREEQSITQRRRNTYRNRIDTRKAPKNT